MKLSKIEKMLLNDLFKAQQGLFLFTLYSRYKVSPKELFKSIKKLESENIILNKDERVILTKEGVRYAISKNICSSKKTEKSKIKQEFLGNRIEINSFYIPIDFQK